MDELRYKHHVCDLLRAMGADVQQHEDKIENFIPDLSYAIGNIDGWIEVKYLRKTPKTLADLGHLTIGQIEWLKKRGKHGSGQCWLLIGSEQDQLSYLWHYHQLSGVRHLDWAEATVAAYCGGPLQHVLSALRYTLRLR